MSKSNQGANHPLRQVGQPFGPSIAFMEWLDTLRSVATTLQKGGNTASNTYNNNLNKRNF